MQQQANSSRLKIMAIIYTHAIDIDLAALNQLPDDGGKYT